MIGRPYRAVNIDDDTLALCEISGLPPGSLWWLLLQRKLFLWRAPEDIMLTGKTSYLAVINTCVYCLHKQKAELRKTVVPSSWS